MQFTNNYPFLGNQKRKYILIGGGIFIGLLLIIAIYSSQNNKKSAIDNQEVYYDPGSGETVSNPAGKSPESFGSSSKTSIYLGFDDLLDVGVTKLQLDAIKKAFDNYSLDGNKQIKEISLTVASIKRLGPDRDTNESRDIVTFDVTIDRKQPLRAKMESESIKVSRIYLYDLNNKLLFDSNYVDASVAD